MAAGFWSACYAVQPSKTVARPLVTAVARSKRGAQAQAAYSAALAQATRTVARMPWLNRVRLIGGDVVGRGVVEGGCRSQCPYRGTSSGREDGCGPAAPGRPAEPGCRLHRQVEGPGCLHRTYHSRFTAESAPTC